MEATSEAMSNGREVDQEPLRAFKARHGERRAPEELQRLLLRAVSAVAVALGLTILLMAHRAWESRGKGRPFSLRAAKAAPRRCRELRGLGRRKPQRTNGHTASRKHARRRRDPPALLRTARDCRC